MAHPAACIQPAWQWASRTFRPEKGGCFFLGFLGKGMVGFRLGYCL